MDRRKFIAGCAAVPFVTRVRTPASTDPIARLTEAANEIHRICESEQMFTPVATDAMLCSCASPATHVVALDDSSDVRSWACQPCCELHAREAHRKHPDRFVAAMPGAALIGGRTIQITAFKVDTAT